MSDAGEWRLFPDLAVVARDQPGMLSGGKGQGEAVIVRGAYAYRLYPTRAQDVAMETILHRTRELYNAGLEERREAYPTGKASLASAGQKAQLPAIKALRPEYAELDALPRQDVLERLDRAFAGFFRRVKLGLKGTAVGYPRFKSRDRYDSFTFKQTGWKLIDGRLVLRGLGCADHSQSAEAWPR